MTTDRQIINELTSFIKRRVFNYSRMMKNRHLNEQIEGGSPDEFEFMGERYVALEDSSFPVLYHNGKWLSGAETHRDLICLDKYGCEEWQVEEYYSWENRQIIFSTLNRLWSDSNEYNYLSRVFDAKENAKRHGYKYILVSWDKLEEKYIMSICKEFGINREELVYVPTFDT